MTVQTIHYEELKGATIATPEPSDWECHLFGGGPMGIVYTPRKGAVPHALARWMMRVCFDCRWVRKTKRVTG